MSHAICGQCSFRSACTSVETDQRDTQSMNKLYFRYSDSLLLDQTGQMDRLIRSYTEYIGYITKQVNGYYYKRLSQICRLIWHNNLCNSTLLFWNSKSEALSLFLKLKMRFFLYFCCCYLLYTIITMLYIYFIWIWWFNFHFN